ncbi:MAG: hypothetical protein ACO3Z6_06410 [Pseudomonadales bacterium]
MSDPISLTDAARKRDARKRAELQERARGNTLCRSGFHEWAIDQKKQFDVRSGKLVTVLRCTRCPTTKTRLD